MEIDKDKARQVFLSTHPEFSRLRDLSQTELALIKLKDAKLALRLAKQKDVILQREKRHKRRAEIAKDVFSLYKSGHTHQSLAKLKGVTYQRIQQILKQNPEYTKNIKPKIEFTCPKCNKKLMLTSSQFKVKNLCSMDCKRLKRTLEEKRAIWRERTTKYYHEVTRKRPDFHEWVRKNNEKYALKRKTI